MDRFVTQSQILPHLKLVYWVNVFLFFGDMPVCPTLSSVSPNHEYFFIEWCRSTPSPLPSMSGIVFDSPSGAVCRCHRDSPACDPTRYYGTGVFARKHKCTSPSLLVHMRAWVLRGCQQLGTLFELCCEYGSLDCHPMAT